MPLVTENMIFASLSNSVAQSEWSLQQAQLHASSGLRVMTPSDDPAAASQGNVLNTGLQSLAAMDAAAKQVNAQLSASSLAINTAQTLLAKAKEFAVQTANGTLTASDRANIAAEVGTLQSTLLALANTQENGVYLFAGFANGSAPFAADGTYSGDDGVRQVEVSPAQSVGMNIAGSQVFNVPGGQNVLAVLATLQADLLANNAANIAADISSIDNSVTQVAQAQAQVGGALTVLQASASTRQSMSNLLATQRSAVTEVNASSALTAMMQAQGVYQAAVAEATRMLSTLSNSLTR